MKYLFFQLIQFFKPFPAPKSWAYRYKLWGFKKRIARKLKANVPVLDMNSMETDHEDKDFDYLDIPTYIRRDSNAIANLPDINDFKDWNDGVRGTPFDESIDSDDDAGIK